MNGMDNLLDTNQGTSLENITIGQSVIIKKMNSESIKNTNPEDFYYLREFENKTGIICEKRASLAGIYTYRVDFGKNRFGYFYSKDFSLI